MIHFHKSLFVLFLSYMTIISSANSEEVGVLNGKAGVSASGAATYSIPIEVPPALSGLQPSISLQYNSQARHVSSPMKLSDIRPGTGSMGVGWSIAGLSAISRCQTDWTRDGGIDAVDYDDNDQFCLDGQRLILISGTHGATGAVYRTEINANSKILVASNEGYGPTSFKVISSNGQVTEYGFTSASRQEAHRRSEIDRWNVNAIKDSIGNKIDFVYEKDRENLIYRISRVEYEEKAVEFNYELGATTLGLLEAVKVKVAYDIIHDYKVGPYLGTLTNRKVIQNITKCNAVEECFHNTEFTWTQAEKKFDSSTWSSVTPAQMRSPVLNEDGGETKDYQVLSGDFNGDGLTDIATISKNGFGDWSKWVSVDLSTGTGYKTEFWPSLTPTQMRHPDRESDAGNTKNYQVLTGDFNGDGLTDIATISKDGFDGWADWISVDLSTGSGFKTEFWESHTPAQMRAGGSTKTYKVLTGDYNGDGLTDIATISKDATGDWSEWLSVDLSTGSGFESKIWSSHTPAQMRAGGATKTYQVLTGDYNGDGLTDIATISKNATGDWSQWLSVDLSTGSGFNSEIWDSHTPAQIRAGGATKEYQVLTGDYNGDGLTDIATISKDAIGDWSQWLSVDLSTGTGFESEIWNSQTPSQMRAGGATKEYLVLTGDYNGDGLTDIVTISKNGGGDWSKWIAVDLSVGSGFETKYWESITPAQMRAPDQEEDAGNTKYYRVLTGDYNGDGISDLATISQNGKFDWSEWIAMDLSSALSGKPDLLTNIEQLPGNQTTFKYKSLTDNATYSKGDALINYPIAPGGEGGYPVPFQQSTLSVVSDIQATNGQGGTNSTSYFYEGMKTHRLGLGSLGFAKVTTTNDQTGIINIAEYEQDYENRLIGNVKSTKTITPADAISGNPSVEISASTSLWESEGTPGSTYKIKLRKTTTQNKSLSGTNTYKRETSYCVTDAADCTALPTSYDEYGNPLVVNSTVTDQQNDGETFTTQTTNEYWGLNHFATASDFYTSQIHRVTVVKDGSNRDRKTRVAEFNEYYANGKLKKETVEPGDDQLITEYEYEITGYGRITQKTVRGAYITTRSSSIAYDASNPYLSSSTNALNQTTTTKLSPKWGAALNKTDANNLSVSHTYDDFGRRASDTMPDGTTVTYELDWCVSNCPENAVYFSTITTTDALSTNHSKIYFNSLKRKVAASTLGFDGSDIQVGYLYDALGRQYKTSLPYFVGSEIPIYKENTKYDILNRVTEVTHPNTSTSSIVYDGLTTTYTNAKSQQKIMVKNALGETITSTDDDFKELSLEYDAQGNLITTTDEANNSVVMDYNMRGNKTSMTDPDKGHWKYEYNVLGQLVMQTDAKNQSTCMVYDVLGRMTKRIDDYLASNSDYDVVRTSALNGCAGDAFNTQIANWTFDSSPVKGVGKLHTITGANDYSKTMTYDSLGRVKNKAITIDGKTHNVGKTYYANTGKVDTLVYPLFNGSAFTVRNTYKPTGFLYKSQDISNGVNGAVYWQATDMNARLQLTNFTLGNGVSTTNTYNPNTGFIEVIDSLKGGVTGIQYLDYQYNDVGNLEHRKDFVKGLSEQFGYDELNRLTGSTITGTDAVGAAFREDEVSGYDNNGLGNIQSKTGVGIYSYGSPSTSCAVNFAGPHAVTSISGGSVQSATNYCYDQNGDMVSGADRNIEYAAFGKPALMTKGTNSVEFIYGPSRTRTQRIDNSLTTTTYVEGIYEELETSGVLTGKYYIGNYAMVTKEASSTETHYLHRDHLGSVDAITNDLGIPVASQQMSFDAWGKRREATWDSMSTLDLFNSNAQITNRGYTNHEQVDSMGLIHMNGRMYDSILARFISADPVVQAPLDMQSYNRYSYVRNNPLAYTDPTGYSWLSKELDRWGEDIRYELRHFDKSVLQKHSGVIVSAVISYAMCGGEVACTLYSIATSATLSTPGGQKAVKYFAQNVLEKIGVDEKHSTFLSYMILSSGIQLGYQMGWEYVAGTPKLETTLIDNSKIDDPKYDEFFADIDNDPLSEGVSGQRNVRVLSKTKGAKLYELTSNGELVGVMGTTDAFFDTATHSAVVLKDSSGSYFNSMSNIGSSAGNPLNLYGVTGVCHQMSNTAISRAGYSGWVQTMVDGGIKGGTTSLVMYGSNMGPGMLEALWNQNSQ